MFTALPKTEVARVLGRQVLRSGTSVGANYREAYRSPSRTEFVSKAGDCLIRTAPPQTMTAFRRLFNAANPEN